MEVERKFIFLRTKTKKMIQHFCIIIQLQVIGEKIVLFNLKEFMAQSTDKTG